MYFINNIEEEARAELQGIVNQEYSEFVKRDRKEGIVDFEAIRTDSMNGFDLRNLKHKQQVINIMFGDYWDSHQNYRVHYIAKGLWTGDYTIEEATMIIPVLREQHSKPHCAECNEERHPLRIPTLETIEKLYRKMHG